MFNPDKPVQTRDGRKARIICTDRKDSHYPIVALVSYRGEDYEHCEYFTSDGLYSISGELGSDLINIPDTKYLTVYITVNGKLIHGLFDSKNEAMSLAINKRASGRKVLLEAHPVEV